MASQPAVQEVGVAQGRMMAYGLIAGAFRYPDRDLLNMLAVPERWSDWPERLGEVNADAGDTLVAVRERLGEEASKLSDDAAGEPIEPDELQAAYVRLFGHTVRGTCPPYELEYARGQIHQQAVALADIGGFYSAFGLELTDDGNERVDHVSVQCEFMGVLARKEAYAIEQNDAEALAVVRDAQRSFLEDHLGRWLSAFTRRVQDADPDGFYGAMAAFAGAVVAAECRRLDVASGPKLLELRPADLPLDATMTCSPEESCPGCAADLPAQGGDAPTSHGAR